MFKSIKEQDQKKENNQDREGKVIFHSHHSNYKLKNIFCGNNGLMYSEVGANLLPGAKFHKGRQHRCKRNSCVKPSELHYFHLRSSFVILRLSQSVCSFISCHQFTDCGATQTICAKRLCTHHGVGVSGSLQVMAALGVGVGTDAETIRGVELLDKEGAASLDHR